jgi:hypothetical protein
MPTLPPFTRNSHSKQSCVPISGSVPHKFRKSPTSGTYFTSKSLTLSTPTYRAPHNTKTLLALLTGSGLLNWLPCLLALLRWHNLIPRLLLDTTRYLTSSRNISILKCLLRTIILSKEPIFIVNITLQVAQTTRTCLQPSTQPWVLAQIRLLTACLI